MGGRENLNEFVCEHDVCEPVRNGSLKRGDLRGEKMMGERGGGDQ